ncbi:MAG: alanine dehydrogenase [Bacteroidetes bacterium]|nr:alanine dehydrogenase [Bacteroidota bacterium]
MVHIGLIREEKTPPDTRVALTPQQCKEAQRLFGIKIWVEPSPNRCFPDSDYIDAGIEMKTDLSGCDILIGIKEVPIDKLIEGKTYLFFSHTKKKQPYNQKLMQALIKKRIRLIDYECLTHTDGQRILGFGFFAGVIGAHNGLLTYGKKFAKFHLTPAHHSQGLEDMTEQYKDVYLPPIKIAVTGSGKVASGIVDIMDRFDIEFVEPEDYLEKQFSYPVYTHLKGNSLYVRKDNGTYHREDFHHFPQDYQCSFKRFLPVTDILMNGIYWDKNVPRLFEKEAIQQPSYKMNVIADITCDMDGSVPINLGASTIADPVYGVDKKTFQKVAPFQNRTDVVDIMAVDNLPNELPQDASRHFGQHIIKYILAELLSANKSNIIDRATICSNGQLTEHYEYLSDYAY